MQENHNKLFVFVIKSPLPKPVIRCYQSLSLTICKALLKEETNSEYLTNQSKILNDFIDDHQNIDSSKLFLNPKTFLMKVTTK